MTGPAVPTQPTQPQPQPKPQPQSSSSSSSSSPSPSPSSSPGPGPGPGPAPRPRASLRGRLLARLLPVVFGLFALSGALSYFGASYYANRVYDRWLQDSAEALALRITVNQGRPTLDLPEAAREILQWDATDTTWYEIVGEGRGHIAGQLGLPRRPWEADPAHSRRFDGQVGATPVRVASVTVTPRGADERVQVLVAETLRKRQALAAELMLSVLLPELALLATAVIVVTWTLRRMLLPVGRIAEALEAQTHHSLEPLDDRDLPAEVLPLTQAMNSLLLRLKAALLAQRHFIADAAHQLRTPLTALKLHTDEAAREAAGSADPGRLRPLIGDLQRAADRAVRLSNQLLTLARAEPSAALPNRERFDLRAAAVEAAGRWIPTALGQGVDLGFDEAEGPAVPIVADRLLVTEALNNLIDNALKYGRPAGRITVTVGEVGTGDGRRARLAVTDDGPGIPAAERARVLERFQRLEPAARSQRDGPGPGAVQGQGQASGSEAGSDAGSGSGSDAGSGSGSDAGSGSGSARAEAPTGSGLGLAIVVDIARGHDGQLTLDDGPDGRGLVVAIDWPLAPGPAPEDPRG